MMKNVLVIGSTGQIGSELTMKIRREIPGSTVVAGYIPGAEPKGVLLESGPAELADVRDAAGLAAIVEKYSIDTVYNLAALLSAVAEKKPLLAWDIQMNGLLNILEVAREKKCAVFTPSSIGSFGPETPHVGTPQDTIQRPRSMYGVTKVATELLSDYDLECHPAWRRHHGLRRGGVLFRRERGGVRLPHRSRHLYGHDVHA